MKHNLQHVFQEKAREKQLAANPLINGIEHAGVHIALKKIIKLDQEKRQQDASSSQFGSAVLDNLTEDGVRVFFFPSTHFPLSYKTNSNLTFTDQNMDPPEPTVLPAVADIRKLVRLRSEAAQTETEISQERTEEADTHGGETFGGKTKTVTN